MMDENERFVLIAACICLTVTCLGFSTCAIQQRWAEAATEQAAIAAKFCRDRSDGPWYPCPAPMLPEQKE